MLVKYELDVSDLVFAAKHMVNAPPGPVIAPKWWLHVFGWPFVAFVFSYHSFGLVVALWILVLLTALSYWWIIVRYKRAWYAWEKNLHTQYGLDDNRIFRGNRELEIRDDAWIVRSDLSEQRYVWDALWRVCDTPRHLMLYIAPIQVHVVPKRRLHPGTTADLIADLRRRTPAERWIDQTAQAGGSMSGSNGR